MDHLSFLERAIGIKDKHLLYIRRSWRNLLSNSTANLPFSFPFMSVMHTLSFFQQHYVWCIYMFAQSSLPALRHSKLHSHPLSSPFFVVSDAGETLNFLNNYIAYCEHIYSVIPLIPHSLVLSLSFRHLPPLPVMQKRTLNYFFFQQLY